MQGNVVFDECRRHPSRVEACCHRRRKNPTMAPAGDEIRGMWAESSGQPRFKILMNRREI
jgi:hypothetical protein